MRKLIDLPFEERRRIGRERIMDNSIPVTELGCWLWLGSTNDKGYGQPGWTWLSNLAHRSAYMAFIGPIPDGLHVCHKCDTRCCVNPSHLFVGTHRDNMDDRTRKGRSTGQRGEAHNQARLTSQQVLEIRALRGKMLTADIGAMYGVSDSYVSGIQLNKRRKWL